MKILYNVKAPLVNSKLKMDNHTIVQNLLYADDMVLISSNYDDLEGLMNLTTNYLERFGLKINIEKTKRTTIIPEKTNLSTIARRINNIEEVEQFKYLGTILTNEVKLDAEIDAHVSKDLMAFGCLNKLVWYQPSIKH